MIGEVVKPLSAYFFEPARFTSKIAKRFESPDNVRKPPPERMWMVVEQCASCLDMLKAAVLFNDLFPSSNKNELKSMKYWIETNRDELTREKLISGLQFMFAGTGKDDPEISEIELIEAAYHIDHPRLYTQLKIDLETKVEQILFAGDLNEIIKLLKRIDNSSFKDEEFLKEIAYRLAEFLGDKLTRSSNKGDIVFLYAIKGISKLVFKAANPMILDEKTYEHLREIKSLQELVFVNVQIKLDLLPRDITSLRIIGFTCDVDKDLSRAPITLRTLEIRNSNITSSFLLDIPPLIEQLILVQCNEIDDDLGKYLPVRLTYLDVSSCHKLSNVFLSKLPKSVRHLRVSGLDKITDEGLKFLPPDLKALNASHTSITDNGLKKIPPTVELLELNDKITNAGLSDLPQFLRSLSLADNKHINREGLWKLCSTLRELNLSDTKVADDDLRALPAGLRVLRLARTKIIEPFLPNLISLDVTHTAFNDVGVARLPPTLLVLAAPIKTNKIINLPANILSLHIYATDGLACLPHILSLDLTRCKELKPEHLAQVPKSARIVNISETSIDPEVAKHHLPYNCLLRKDGKLYSKEGVYVSGA